MSFIPEKLSLATQNTADAIHRTVALQRAFLTAFLLLWPSFEDLEERRGQGEVFEVKKDSKG